MTATTYSPSHPIVFVFDFSNEGMEVPVYDAESVVSANESCVSVRTIADVDGAVTVTLESLSSTPSSEWIEVFRGTINAPSHKVAVVTSENQKLLEEKVASSQADVRILVDDAENPSKLLVGVR